MKYYQVISVSMFLILVLFSVSTDHALSSENNIVLLSNGICKHGLTKLNSSPYSIFSFCEDTLGNYLAIVYYEKMSLPVDGSWSLSDRVWQNEEWSKDVVSYFYDCENSVIFVSTSEIYGEGGIYRLDLEKRKYEKLTNDAVKEGRVYELTKIDKQNHILICNISLDGKIVKEISISTD